MARMSELPCPPLPPSPLGASPLTPLGPRGVHAAGCDCDCDNCDVPSPPGIEADLILPNTTDKWFGFVIRTRYVRAGERGYAEEVLRRSRVHHLWRHRRALRVGGVPGRPVVGLVLGHSDEDRHHHHPGVGLWHRRRRLRP
eukprot:6922531-Pyramimonas_sp.AAC.1